jgi:hypothetical protein
MTGLRLLDGVDGKRANGIDAKLVELGLVNHGFPPLERAARLGPHAAAKSGATPTIMTAAS